MLQASDIRLFLQDRPEYNRLLESEEFSQKLIDQAMKFTVVMFNDMEPATGYTMDNFPFQSILLWGTVFHLMFSGGLLRSRNKLEYQTDGVQINGEAHGGIELALSDKLEGKVEKMMKAKKIEMNVRNCWGTVTSEYLYPHYQGDLWRM